MSGGYKFRQKQANANSRRAQQDAPQLYSVRDRHFSDKYKQNLSVYLKEQDQLLMDFEQKTKTATTPEKRRMLEDEYFDQNSKKEIAFIRENMQELLNSASEYLHKPAFAIEDEDKLTIVGTTAMDIAKTFEYSKGKSNYVERICVKSIVHNLQENNIDFLTHEQYKEQTSQLENKSLLK